MIQSLVNGQPISTIMASDDLTVLNRQRAKLIIRDKVLYRQVSDAKGITYQLVVPADHRAKILSSLHDDLGHPGRDKLSALVRSRFYWPRMDTDIEQKTSNCRRCLCRKSHGQKAQLVPILTTQPLELVCLDYLQVEPSHGFEHLLVIVDHFTKFARVVPTRNETAKTTAKAFYENFISLYGFPHSIHSDQGRNFESGTIRELCLLTGIAKSHTSPYHPMGNGACERLNQTLLKMLGTLEADKKARWKDHLNTLVHAYNSTPHETTGYAPYELLFGRAPRLPIDHEYHLKGETAGDNYNSYVEELKKSIVFSHKLAREAMAGKANDFKQPHKPAAVLRVGDKVLVRKLGIIGRCKLADKWEESVFTIQQHPNKDIPVYVVKPLLPSGRERTLHRNLLLPIETKPTSDTHNDTDTSKLNDSLDIESSCVSEPIRRSVRPKKAPDRLLLK